MSNVNCYVCNRGFPHIDLLYAHLGEHPGRTAEEMAQAAEAWGRLKGTDKAWMLREAAHNDEHEVTTEIPGFAVNDALAHQANREKAAAVKAGGKAGLTAPHGVDGPDEVATVTPITFVDESPVSAEEWAEHDRAAEAQRKPYSEVAQDYAARHLYKARQIPHLEAVGLDRNAEYARREDAAEAEVAAERAAGLTALDERDRLLEKSAFDPSLPDTAKTRQAFADHKARLREERAAESAAMFVEQFPKEAEQQGVKKPRLSRRSRKAVETQKREAEAAVNKRVKDTGGRPPTATALSQVNENVDPDEATGPTPTVSQDVIETLERAEDRPQEDERGD